MLPAPPDPQPTIVVLPEWKEAAAGEAWHLLRLKTPAARLEQGAASWRVQEAVDRWPGPSRAGTGPDFDFDCALTLTVLCAVMCCALSGPKERGIRLFTVHVRRGPPDVQDPCWNSLSKLNCISACIQVHTWAWGACVVVCVCVVACCREGCWGQLGTGVALPETAPGSAFAAACPLPCLLSGQPPFPPAGQQGWC